MSRVEPFDAIEDMLAFNSRDWGRDKADAWLWGIVHGWDADEPGESGAMDEMATKHRWTPEQVERLRELHAAWKKAKKGITA